MYYITLPSFKLINFWITKLMKKIFALFIIWIYALASNTLVHSFCAKMHLQETFAEHDCCDESDEDCYDNCLSLYGDSLTSTIQFTENTKHIVDNYVFVFDKEELLEDIANQTYLSEHVFDPPRQEIYIWITKKLE